MPDVPPSLDPTVVPFTRGAAVFVVRGQLLVDELFRAVLRIAPLAVHPSGDLWLYRSGRFVADRFAIDRLVTRQLGDDFRKAHLDTFKTYAAAELDGAGMRLGQSASHLLNVANGVLDPFTGRLHAHDPSHLFAWQLPTEWQPDARCPTFDRWLVDVLPSADLRDALTEDLATVLDLRRLRQKRALYLAGPPRSGKSTLARIMEALVGHDHEHPNCSAEELHDLSTNRFRAAQLFGKRLNVASDIKGEHLTDVALFKKASGDDTISAEHKFGHPFQFRFDGLFLWTMNHVPSVNEIASSAYLARIRPYRFTRSFEGHEDPSIESRIIGHELPGLLVRLVEALRSLETRGGYLVNAATEAERRWFSRQTDRLAMFLDECTRPGPWCPRSALRHVRPVGHRQPAWRTDGSQGVLRRAGAPRLPPREARCRWVRRTRAHR